MKNYCRLAIVGVFASCLTGVLISRASDLPIDVIVAGETIIEGGSQGLTTVAVEFAANNLHGATCTGPSVNCASGPSPDCDTGDCNAITSITVPSCQTKTAWIGEYHCYQNGMECENGSCPDGFMCFNSVEGACTSDWWWF